MNSFPSNIPYSLRPAESLPALCVLPQRHAPYQADTPDWTLANGFRSDICSNIQVDPIMAMLCIGGAISTVVQLFLDVQRPNGLTGPASTWSCFLGDASSRKSTVDTIVNRPTRLFDARQLKRHAEKDRKKHVKKLVINAKKMGYLKAIQSGVMSSFSGEDSLCELSGLIEQSISDKIEKLLESMPDDKPPLTFIIEDITKESLLDQLSVERSAKGIISPEALNVFTGRYLQAQSCLNSVYSGDSVTVHRKSGVSYTIDDARVSQCVQVQPEPFLALVNDKVKGQKLRYSGHASRFMFARSTARAGTRFDNTGVQQWPYRKFYERRMGELLAEALQYYLNPDQPRKVLKFTKEAGEYWLKIYNAIELETAPNGRFARCTDHGGKLGEIIARVAAIFHYFEHGNCEISVSSLEYAMRLCIHCSDCYLDIFDPIPQHISDAIVLYDWLNMNVRARNISVITKNEIRQYGPNELRERNRLNQALFALYNQKCINFVQWGKTHYVELLPFKYAVFDVQVNALCSI